MDTWVRLADSCSLCSWLFMWGDSGFKFWKLVGVCSSMVFPVLLCSAQFFDPSADPDQWLEELQIGAEFVGSNTRGSIGRRPERAVARQPHQVEMLRECIAKYCQKYGNLLGFSSLAILCICLYSCSHVYAFWSLQSLHTRYQHFTQAWNQPGFFASLCTLSLIPCIQFNISRASIPPAQGGSWQVSVCSMPSNSMPS